MIKPVQRLAPLFAPSMYTLHFNLTKRIARTFSGSVTITGNLIHPSKHLILHSKDLEIQIATIDALPTTITHGADDELILESAKQLTAGEHTVAITFSGVITDPMHGLYPCYFTYKGEAKELLMTQLESHYARELFPCVDEPAAKAIFHTTLVTDPGITVLGNTPVANQVEKDGTLTTSFQPTPRMSVYLLAFVAGELDYLEMKNDHGVIIRTYATLGKAEQTRFALELAAKTLDFYDDYFGTPYPLPKCDMVAVPDFAAGAMENWGLITYRESMMLIDAKHAAADTKEGVANVVAHELSHQWFGNLVTMQWWDDIWLNESFANFMEHYAVDHFYPEWHVWEQFSGGEQQYAFNRDGLAQVQAVKQPVHHPDELHGLFDSAIVYAKGSCLLRMLHGYLGAETFRDGLRLYMSQHAYHNTTADDLWVALAEVSKKNVSAFMEPWLHQPGHPIVTVQVEDSTVNLQQQRFYANPLQRKADDRSSWSIPLLSEQLHEEILTTQEATFTHHDGDVLLNRGYTGFYHTHYESEQLERLAVMVASNKLSEVNRLGLLADNLALTKAGLSSTVDLIHLLSSYSKETAYPVWQSIFAVIGAVQTIINEDESLKTHLQRYIKQLVEPEYTRLGWEPLANEPYFDQLLRPSLIALMAYAEVPSVIEHLLELFDAAKNPEDLFADIRPTIYAVAVRERGEAAFDRLMAWYKQTDSAEERINITSGITAVKDTHLVERLTSYFTTKLIKPQDLFYWFIYLMRSRYGRNITWQWMITNWDWITQHYKGDHDYADFPKYAASCMSTRKQLEMYRQFFEPKLNETDIAMVIRQGLEDIEVRVLWRERDLEGVSAFLKAYPTV